MVSNGKVTIWQRILTWVSSGPKKPQNEGGIKLWADGITAPPQGWLWTRTYDETINVLLRCKVSQCSIGTTLDPLWTGSFEEGCNLGRIIYGHRPPMGYDIISWMAVNDVWPDEITVHSADDYWHRCMVSALARWRYQDGDRPNKEQTIKRNRF